MLHLKPPNLYFEHMVRIIKDFRILLQSTLRLKNVKAHLDSIITVVVKSSFCYPVLWIYLHTFSLCLLDSEKFGERKFLLKKWHCSMYFFTQVFCNYYCSQGFMIHFGPTHVMLTKWIRFLERNLWSFTTSLYLKM